jgi:hypothetical protein
VVSTGAEVASKPVESLSAALRAIRRADLNLTDALIESPSINSLTNTVPESLYLEADFL